jgi:predicted DNA-binding WGR domain protein
MQLIQRKTLVYQAGSSDKVYEVDLCQLATDRYVVNYRFGRRGGTLKEGCQTPSALALAAAQLAFDKLVNSKLAKGYQDSGAAVTVAPKAPAPVFVPDFAGRNQHILDRLTAAVSNPSQPSAPKQWPIDRVIWRSGELQLTAAAPLLMQLWGNQPLRNYSIAWALGNCGDAQAIPLLEQAYRDIKNPDHVRRICLEAIFKLSEAKKTALRAELMVQLPVKIRSAIEQQESMAVLLSAFWEYLSTAAIQDFSVIDLLYQIDQESCRHIILNFVQETPFESSYDDSDEVTVGGYKEFRAKLCRKNFDRESRYPESMYFFKYMRHILKTAEYRCDAEVLGILTYRLDLESPFYPSDIGYLYFDQERPGRPQDFTVNRWKRDNQTNKYRNFVSKEFKQEISSIDSRLAYGSKTRDYLRRRVWRSLKALGELAQPAYIDTAAAILLQYSDENAVPPQESVRYSDYNYQTYQYNKITKNHWDAYAEYLTLNHILYTNSPRYELKSGKDIWQCKKNYKPGDPMPAVREEAFPELWNQQPAILLRLLCESACKPVHEFAAKAIADSPEFCQEISIDNIIQLLAKPYEVTAQFSFGLAKSRYQPQSPQAELILAIANCAYAPARTEAYGWLSAQIDRFLADDVLITGLVLSPQPDTQIFIRQALSTTIIATNLAQSLIGRIIAGLLTFTPEQAVIAENATQTLTTCFQTQLRSIGLEVILDLLRHPLATLQTTGARILLDRQTPAIASLAPSVIDLPAGLIDALIESPIDAVRSIGVQLFGQLPDEMLVDRLELILSFTTHPLPEMRQAIVPCLRRLKVYPEFMAQLIDRLLPVLLAPEASEGLHSFISQLLQNDLPNWMEVANPATAWMLLSAPATASQELSGRLLQTNADRWVANLSTERIAELTHHEILVVREAGWQMLGKILPRLRQSSEDLLAATLVMASKWDDSRAYGFTLFGEILQPAELTPAVVISICDSNREDVRRFGRDLVSKCFQAQDGLEYLLKFSEHPTTDMQLFASQYLEDYAANNLERLAELTPYFGRVLAQVNRARVAKERIFNFLSAEATKSANAAQLVIEVLTRQSASIAVSEKARSLETLLKIHQLYPELTVPIKIKEATLKH